MANQLEKLIEEIVEEALEEVNALSAGGSSLQPSGQVSGTGGNPLGRDMSDQHEIMWSGDEPEEKKSLKEEILEEEELEEINAIGTGAVVGYTLPLGMKPDYQTMGTKGKKKKRPRRWYDVHKESKLKENKEVKIRVVDNEEQVASAVIKFDGKIATLDSIIVKPNRRRKGIGRRLYKAANEEAKKRFGVSLTSSEFLTPHSRKMWTHLADEGLARQVGDHFQMEGQTEPIEEEYIGKKGGVSYFQIGGSLPDHLYNRTDDGKPTRDPGVAGLNRPKKKKKK